MTERSQAPLDKIECALSEIEIALGEDMWPTDIVRTYQRLSALIADHRLQTEGGNPENV